MATIVTCSICGKEKPIMDKDVNVVSDYSGTYIFCNEREYTLYHKNKRNHVLTTVEQFDKEANT